MFGFTDKGLDMLNQGLYSSATDQWDTPPELVAGLRSVISFDVDVCASRPNVCSRFYSEAENGLRQTWRGICWMNPPYGREIGKWVRKARESRDTATTVCLVPARTDTRWWQANIPFASLVVFLRGRLKFGDGSGSAPFPSAFVVFGRGLSPAQIETLRSYGLSGVMI